MKQNILVVGAGYVGKAAAQAWKAQGHFVSITTRSKKRQEELEREGFRVHLIAPGQLYDALKGQHTVLLSVAPDISQGDEETYLGSARALVADLDSTTEQILYTSSTSVYGEHGGALVDENTPLRPVTERERILAETEQLLQAAACNVCILRFGEIVGPGRMLVDRLRTLQRRPLAGTGEAICNLSPLEEIIKALLTASERGWSGIYNVCSDLHMPRRQLYEQICQEEGLPQVVWDPTRTSPHAGNKTVSNAKYRKTCL